MTLRVKLHDNNAKLPRANADNTYDIYTIDEKIIPSRKMLAFATGISIALPIGYTTLITSCELNMSNSIETSNYHVVDYRGDTALLIYLRNSSQLDYKIRVGDCIAKLHIVRSKILPIECVQNITPQITEQEIIGCFTRSYKNNSFDTMKRYISTASYLDMLAKIQNCEEYKQALHRIDVEIHFIWMQLDEKIKQRIRDDIRISANN
jgi:dUTP pyrophosphatase